MNIIERWKQRAKAQAAHEEELSILHEEYTLKIRAIKESHKKQLDRKNSDIVDINKEKESIMIMSERDIRISTEKLEETEQMVDSYQLEHDRVQSLLTKLEKRARLYRRMIYARDEWEAEVLVSKEEDKIEEFIKWKNERENLT